MSRFIYFISSGTSSNDLGKSGKNDLSYFGYKQLCKLKKNKYFIGNILSQNIEILTSSDRNCVESSLILFTNNPQQTVNVVPYLSNKRDKNINHIQLFQRNLDKKQNKHYLETLNYGKNHIIKNLIKEFPIINYDLNKNSKNYYFNASKFKSLLEQKVNTSPGIIVVLCDSIVIRAILKNLASSKYRQIKDESFEKSSVWEVEFNFDTQGKIIYKLFSKKYPIPTTYEPLEYKGGKYLCEFKGSYIPIFEKKSEISDDLLKKISSSSISNINIIKSNGNDDPFPNTATTKINGEQQSQSTKKNTYSIISNYSSPSSIQ
jgi:hypothetical protein